MQKEANLNSARHADFLKRVQNGSQQLFRTFALTTKVTPKNR